ncbi:MAG: xanthine dehydrogenase family protein molybdopterin-binding subunit [Chloroflexia bacterium]
MAKQVVGTPVKRREDPELLRGDARFTADMTLPGMLHMAILRSPHGHARITSMDVSAAERMPGVVRVITADDIATALMPLPCIWIPGGVESHFPSHPFGMPGAGRALQGDRVRYIGDSVAAVVAETRLQAYDALEAIRVGYEVLPAVVLAEDAVKDGAPQLHPEVPNNLNALWSCGNKDAADRAIASAEVVVNQVIHNQRTINSPIEPRAALAQYDAASGEYTLYATTQSPHNHRLLLAYMILGIPFNKLRVVGPNVGGSFGTKGYIYPDMPLVLYLAKELGRPVKWVDTRNGLMRSTVQGRDQMQYATLAGARDGRITGLKCTAYANLGAYPSPIGPGVATAMMGRSLTGVYDVSAAYCEVYAAFTNTVPLGAQRGSGRAEATFLVERLVDLFALQIGMDPAEVRRKNMVAADEFPYDNGLGWLYDSGDYETALNRSLEMIGYSDIAAKKQEARGRGKRLGVGMGAFVAVSGVGPSPRMGREGMLGGTWESANIRVQPTGEVAVVVGSKPHGQSHETVYAQIVAQVLGVDINQIEVLHSDTERAPYGQGSYGSRSLSVCGPAVHVTAEKIREKAIKMAAHMFEAAEDDIVFEDGKFSVQGSPQTSRTLQEVAIALWYGWDIPAGMEPNLDSTTFSIRPTSTTRSAATPPLSR